MMLLVIDAGNTNFTFAVFDDDRLFAQWRLTTHAQHTADEYALWLKQRMEQDGIKPESVRHVAIACVVAAALPELRALAKQHFNAEALVVGDPGVNLGITINIDPPAIVGADRLVDAVAAWTRYKQPLMVIDMGTATTFNLVNAKGEFIGGAIAPGAHAMQRVLRDTVSFPLPEVSASQPEKTIGANTAAALQSGLYYGYSGLVERVAAELLKEYNAPMKVIATGGLSSVYAKACPIIEHVEPDLILLGLRDIYALNRP